MNHRNRLRDDVLEALRLPVLLVVSATAVVAYVLGLGLAGAISPIVGLFGIDTAIPMGSIMAVTAALSVLALWLVVRPWTVPPLVR